MARRAPSATAASWRRFGAAGLLMMMVALPVFVPFRPGSVAPTEPPVAAAGSGTFAEQPNLSLAAPALAVPAALSPSGLSLRSGPMPVPLELEIPTLGVSADVASVGITLTDVMDAPMGPADDPIWQEAFWYRGSAVPGAASTALIAAHVDDSLGRPGPFADLHDVRLGDAIVVHDTRTGLDVRFSVTRSATYSLAQTTDPRVLTSIYGSGPVHGAPPQPSSDGLAHLTLITCTGTFRNGTHDHRLVVYATRVA